MTRQGDLPVSAGRAPKELPLFDLRLSFVRGSFDQAYAFSKVHPFRPIGSPFARQQHAPTAPVATPHLPPSARSTLACENGSGGGRRRAAPTGGGIKEAVTEFTNSVAGHPLRAGEAGRWSQVAIYSS